MTLALRKKTLTIGDIEREFGLPDDNTSEKGRIYYEYYYKSSNNKAAVVLFVFNGQILDTLGFNWLSNQEFEQISNKQRSAKKDPERNNQMTRGR